MGDYKSKNKLTFVDNQLTTYIKQVGKDEKR
jgi:hypothetical protein